ncbi:hypothetical protein AgCh_011955 [Apium graveolens]
MLNGIFIGFVGYNIPIGVEKVIEAPRRLMAILNKEQVLKDNKTNNSNSITSLTLTFKALSDVSCLSDFNDLEKLDLTFNIFRGCKVIVAARRMDRLKYLCEQINNSVDASNQVTGRITYASVELNLVGDGEAIKLALEKAWECFGRNDALVDNAGVKSRLGTFLLCGSLCLGDKVPYLKMFSSVSLEKRERVVQKWLRNSDDITLKKLPAVTVDIQGLHFQVTVGASFLSQTIALQDSTTVNFEIWDTYGQERKKHCNSEKYLMEGHENNLPGNVKRKPVNGGSGFLNLEVTDSSCHILN